MILQVIAGTDKYVRCTLQMTKDVNGELQLTNDEFVRLANKLYGKNFQVSETQTVEKGVVVERK